MPQSYSFPSNGEGVALPAPDVSASHLLAVLQHELLLFAGFFFLLGALDDMVVDLYWFWLRRKGEASTIRVNGGELAEAPLEGAAAIFLPASPAHRLVGETIAQILGAWRQAELRLYVGCHRSDRATIEAAMVGGNGDPRLRLVIHDHAGPCTRAACLDRLYEALCRDEERAGFGARMVVIQAPGDRVDPAALGLLDQAIGGADLVQLPLLPLAQPRRCWISAYLFGELAELHGKAMVVRGALEAGLPTTGGGLAIAREVLARLAEADPAQGPFTRDSLALDYEFGLRLAAAGGRCRLLRARHADGTLVATRSQFPATVGEAVRHRALAIQGNALEAWDRLGWPNIGRPASLAEGWMRLRDRRAPLSAMVLLASYLSLAILVAGWIVPHWGAFVLAPLPGNLALLLEACALVLLWRVGARFAFAAREAGPAGGSRAVLAIPLGHLLQIVATARALRDYARSLAVRPWAQASHRQATVREPADAQPQTGFRSMR